MANQLLLDKADRELAQSINRLRRTVGVIGINDRALTLNSARYVLIAGLLREGFAMAQALHEREMAKEGQSGMMDELVHVFKPAQAFADAYHRTHQPAASQKSDQPEGGQTQKTEKAGTTIAPNNDDTLKGDKLSLDESKTKADIDKLAKDEHPIESLIITIDDGEHALGMPRPFNCEIDNPHKQPMKLISSDETVLAIGQDHTLIPVVPGTATLTVKFYKKGAFPAFDKTVNVIIKVG